MRKSVGREEDFLMTNVRFPEFQIGVLDLEELERELEDSNKLWL